MAYSNTNKDKEQVQAAKVLKNIGIVAFTSIIIYSSVSNIWQQWQTLKSAKEKNIKLSKEVAEVEVQNKMLERQIEYATGSAYTERKIREYLGLGGPDDYWLKLPKDQIDFTPKQEIDVVTVIPTILKWWNLFTQIR